MIESILSAAWSLLKNVSFEVGANELHRQLVERFQRAGAADLDLQKVLYASLCDAVRSLGKTLSAENHPHFKAISNPHDRREEQKRVVEIFERIHGKFPKVSALKEPVSIVLEGNARTEVKELLGRLELESDLAALPEMLRSAFESNLPFVMLAHFRQQVATDTRLHALFQLDITTTGFQLLQRELRSIADFLNQRCSSDDPTKIQIWSENLTSSLKNFMTEEFGEVKGKLTRLESKIDKISELISEMSDGQQVQHLGIGFYPVRGKLLSDGNSLPYQQLGGKGLERLCYLLLLADGKVPRYFGNPGQSQYGIDLLVTSANEFIVYQCKNVESFALPEMRQALRRFEDEWLGRPDLPRPKQFVLCCPLSLQERKQNEAWTKLERQFYERTGVSVESWDRNYLDERLRRLPDIVADLFSDQATERFCDLDDWNSDLFRPVTADSGEKTITRYLQKKAAGQIYVPAKLTEDFTEKLERNGSLLIQGLPGSGKTITGLALAESLKGSKYRVFYVSLRHDIDEKTLVNGIRSRLSRPTIFLLDDCHGKFEMLDLVQNGLSAKIRGKGFLVFMARTTPTHDEMPRGDYSDFEESLEEAKAILELQPMLAVFSEIITLVRPHFAGLSKERLRKIFEFTGHDLLLLDQLLATIDSPDQIDQLKPEKLFEKTLVRYFGAPTVHRPGFMRLAALAQFDIAPPVSSFPHDLEEEDEKAATQLLVKADRPLRYFFLHSSAAELVFRALAWNSGCDDYPELAAEHLIEFFKNCQESAKQLAVALSNVLRNPLKLISDKNEQNRLRSQFLADDSIYAFVEKNFDQFPLDVVAVCLTILKSTDEATFGRYSDLVKGKLEEGTVLNVAIAYPIKESGQFLSLVRKDYPLLFSNLRKQLVDRWLPALIKTAEFNKYFLSLLVKLAEPGDSRWSTALGSIPDNEFDEMIQRTIASGRSIGTITFALRELKKTNPALLEKLERKIGTKCYLHLITSAGTIYELFKTIEYSSMAEELIEALDAETLDTLIAKTIASGRSIGTIDLTLRELKKNNLALLENLERKIGAKRHLHLIASAGTISDLFKAIEHSSLSMAGELIDALDADTLDALIAKTIASGRSIGTINLALWELKKTSPALLEKLEQKINSKCWWQLICANGTIGILSDIHRHLDKFGKQQLVQGAKALSLLQWQDLLLRGDFADLSNFVRRASLFFSKQFTMDFLSSLKPTFEKLIRRDGWEALDRGTALIKKSSDSVIKKYLSDLLDEYLVTVDLRSLRCNSFGEAIHCMHLLWQELPSRRNELNNSLFTILPIKEVWYADEKFLRSAHDLFFMLANPQQAMPEDARRVLSIGNSKEVALLCAEATTLDLLFYLWDLYGLWFVWEGDETFASFLHSEIHDIVSGVLKKCFMTQANQEETDNQMQLVGFLSFVELTAFSPAEKAGWLSSLPSFDKLVKRVQFKTFIPGFFFLIGLEWIFDKNGGVPQQTWRRLLSKAEAYTEKTAALEHLRDFVRACAGGKNKQR